MTNEKKKAAETEDTRDLAEEIARGCSVIFEHQRQEIINLQARVERLERRVENLRRFGPNR